MGKFFDLVLEWSEVWALLIPLAVWLAHRKQPAYLKPIVVYLLIALPVNIACNIIAAYYQSLPSWFQYNPPFYNAHSLFRFACFVWFFILLGQSYYYRAFRFIPLVFFVLVVLNFFLIENFFHKDYLSGNLLTVEAYLLLVYCLLYYLAQLKEERETITRGPDFWVATGLCVYVVINFFVFLFYEPMVKEEIRLALNIWNVHNVAYILLSLFIAIAFYVSPRAYHRT